MTGAAPAPDRFNPVIRIAIDLGGFYLNRLSFWKLLYVIVPAHELYRSYLQPGRSGDNSERRAVLDVNREGDPKPSPALYSRLMASVSSDRDQKAFEILFRYFAPRVKSYCLRLGADMALAEDITQETMVSVWRNASQFDPSKAAVSTWIFTIARNLIIDRFRKGRRPEFDPADPAFVPDDVSTADALLEKSQTYGRIRTIMETLSSNERIVLMLSFYENFSHGEIARQLGIPLGTVKSRIRLAFEKMKIRLDSRDGDSGG